MEERQVVKKNQFIKCGFAFYCVQSSIFYPCTIFKIYVILNNESGCKLRPTVQNCIPITSYQKPYGVNRPYKHINSVLLIPNRTFLVHFGGISGPGEFGRAMDRILARRSRDKNTLGETKRA